MHKIKEGAVDKSYGIHVAKLSGMPDELIKRASEILKIYEEGKMTVERPNIQLETTKRRIKIV